MAYPFVVHQHASATDHTTVHIHVFPDSDAFIAWLDSQDVSVYIEVEPREEELSMRWDLVHDRPADIYTPPEDTAHRRRLDFEPLNPKFYPVDYA